MFGGHLDAHLHWIFGFRNVIGIEVQNLAFMLYISLI